MNTDEPSERQRALEQAKALVKTYDITPEELGVSVFHKQASADAMVSQSESFQMVEEKETENEHLSVAETLYNVGAVVILSGAWALVGISWGGLDSVGKILSSLAVVLLAYLAAIGLSRVSQLEKVAPALYLATVATVPIVMIAVLESLELGISGPANILIVALFSGIFSLLGWLFHRIPIFMLGLIAYATIAYVAAIRLWLEALLPSYEYYEEQLAVVAFVVLGGLYCLLSYLSEKFIKSLQIFKNFLFAVGSLFILLSLFTQTGSSPNEVTVMAVLYPIVILAGAAASALLKQPIILAISTVFLIIYLVKITFMYFSDNLGWPASLVLSGVLTVAVGLGANMLAKRFGLAKSN